MLFSRLVESFIRSFQIGRFGSNYCIEDNGSNYKNLVQIIVWSVAKELL